MWSVGDANSGGSGNITMGLEMGLNKSKFETTAYGFPAAGFEMKLGVSGGGGFSFGYDLNLRNEPRLLPVLPPNSINGGYIIFILDITIQTAGTDKFETGIFSKGSAPLKFTLFTSPECKVNLEVTLEPIEVSVNTKLSGSEIEWYKKKIF